MKTKKLQILSFVMQYKKIIYILFKMYKTIPFGMFNLMFFTKKVLTFFAKVLEYICIITTNFKKKGEKL